eukprot:10610351-Alexandrium_andersonii.AAC.1
MLEELEGLGLSSDAMAMAAVVETVSRELLADWAVKNEGMSIVSWAATAITRGDYMRSPSAEMSQGYLLALA